MSLTNTGIFFVWGEPGPNLSHDEINDVYDNHHIPARLAIPGFIAASRYIATDANASSPQPTLLTLYDLTSSQVPFDQAYKSLSAQPPSDRQKAIISGFKSLNRSVYDLIFEQSREKQRYEGGYEHILLVNMTIPPSPPSLEEEINNWYDQVHIRDISHCEEWVRTRRFRLVPGSSINLVSSSSSSVTPTTHKYLTIHSFVHPTPTFNVLASPSFIRAGQTKEAQRYMGLVELEVRSFVLTKKFGPKLDDEIELNDWYDKEHIPGLHSLPSFITTQRYIAADSLTPTYLCIHTLASTDFEYILTSPGFQGLLSRASPREISLLTRVQLFSGRAYEPLFELSSFPNTAASTSLSSPTRFPQLIAHHRPAAKYILLVSVDLIDKSPAFESSLNLWYNTVHIPAISHTVGWVRSRRFEIKDGVEISAHTGGQNIGDTATFNASKESNDLESSHLHAYQYITLHEFSTDKYVSDPATMAAFQSKEAQRMHMLPKVKLDFRHFVLYKDFSCHG
ncbi:hypothetical protein CVT24_012818 [Panaeolus cyanescens]|uniref:Uncharacterized protein n=1 Tax=Panaeolus cyanescens TaxID=181874 RepID=A0A409YJT9_9AGAR|nr:hypothetical protein CVT24_012818 [Panaeolus cyanescens]